MTPSAAVFSFGESVKSPTEVFAPYYALISHNSDEYRFGPQFAVKMHRTHKNDSPDQAIFQASLLLTILDKY